MKDFVAAIKFSEDSCPKYYNTNGLDLKIGDFCVCEWKDGEEIGFVANLEGYPDYLIEKRGLQKILRLATPEEIEHWKELKKKEREAIILCKEKVKKHNLNMKITNVRFDEKNNKVVFNFIADKRVDFRELVKDLAAALKSRIDLWQIGVRDEAKLINGFGICGQPLCCARFIKEFVPVSIKMGKEQDLILSPSKLSGVCGRLMCCLSYEYKYYSEIYQTAPPIGATVKTKSGLEGLVVDRNLLTKILVIEDAQKNRTKASFDEIVSVVIPENLEKKQKEIIGLTAEKEDTEEIPPDDIPINNDSQKNS